MILTIHTLNLDRVIMRKCIFYYLTRDLLAGIDFMRLANTNNAKSTFGRAKDLVQIVAMTKVSIC